MRHLKAAVLALLTTAAVVAAPAQAHDGDHSAAPLANVYFEYNSSTMTNSAKELLQVVVQSVSSRTGTTFVIEGHSDSALAASESLTLSAQMANTVAAYLIELGVPANRIKLMAFGESSPARATADGVREPLNRRVVVSIEG